LVPGTNAMASRTASGMTTWNFVETVTADMHRLLMIDTVIVIR
jgi:hypothetical protein